jgi:cell division protein FtsB
MAIVVGVLAAVVLMLGVPVRSWFVQRADLAAARAQLAAAESQMADLDGQVEQWRDPAFKERQARLRFNYVLPGEVGVVVVPPQAAQPGAPDAPHDWFAALWGSVESSAGRTDAESSSDPLRIRPEAPR